MTGSATPQVGVAGAEVVGPVSLIQIEDESPLARLERFRAALADTIVPFAVRVDAESDLRSARILSGRIGSVDVTSVNAPPIRAFRTSALISASDPDLVKIDVQARGHSVYVQGAREAALAPGDLTLVDLSRPSHLALGDDAHGIIVRFPRSALPFRPSELERLTAVPVSGRDGVGASISSLARHMAGSLERDARADGVRLSAALLDLLVVALAERLDRVAEIAPATLRRALLATVQGFIDQRLSDPLLSPTAIAAAHHISLRYLHKLFESQPYSVAGWIRQRRLEQCRRDLLNPALSHWPVSAIAARWGLGDPSRFSRQFRDAYGLPPAEYRRAAVAAASGPLAGLGHA
jgi:AraC-like DNA-binding protein